MTHILFLGIFSIFSGLGVSPNRWYTPRPSLAWTNRFDSGSGRTVGIPITSGLRESVEKENMKKLLAFGPLFVVVASLLWSFDDLLRRSLYSLPPSVVVFYEHLIGAGVLLFLLPKWFGDIKKMGRKEWIAVVFETIFAGVLGTVLYTAALGKIFYIQFSVVVLLQQLQPIWAILTAWLLLKEKISKDFAFWALIALGAAYCITFPNLKVNIATGSGTILAGLLAVGAGFMWGSSTAISKVVLNKVSSLTTTALRFYFAPIFAFLLIFSLKQTHQLLAITPAQLLTLLLITFSTGALALGIYNYGLKRTPARVTSILELTWPASSIFIGYFLFHQSLTWTQIGGVVVLLVSLYFITKPIQGLIPANESPKT